MAADNAQVIFLASVRDPVTPATIYGVGHKVRITTAGAINVWRSEGKVDLVTPDIRNIRVISKTATTVQIGWTVDVPCTGMRIDLLPAGTQFPGTPANGVGDVIVNVTGLTTATPYSFYVLVYGPGGEHTISPTYPFTTL